MQQSPCVLRIFYYHYGASNFTSLSTDHFLMISCLFRDVFDNNLTAMIVGLAAVLNGAFLLDPASG